MSIYKKRDIIIQINMFVYYPETYNAYTISNKFNSYLKEYFLENKFIDSSYNQECSVVINSTPQNVKEALKIEIYFVKNEVTSINKETVILKLKEFVTDYFNNQIKDINIEFVSNKCLAT